MICLVLEWAENISTLETVELLLALFRLLPQSSSLPVICPPT